MNTQGFALISLSLALFLVGCEAKTKTKIVEVNKEKVYTFTKESYGTPVPVPSVDPNCNSSRGLNLSNAIIENAFTGLQVIETTTNIEEDTFIGGAQKDIFRQTIETENINNGYIVSLCRSAESIPPYSKEGAAIGMKTQADAAHKLYLAIQAGRTRSDVELPALQKINLNAAIDVKLVERNVDKNDKATEETSFLTDNAVFSPNGKVSQLISYPQSTEAKQLGLLGGIPLWSVPGVFQHEFGHFVFHSIMNDSNSSGYAAYLEYSARHPDLHLFHQPTHTARKIAASPGLTANLAAFQQTQQFFIGALNEGFSDLWSYYTMKQPKDMFNISCFAKNRNIASDVYYNGLAKTWDSALWNKVFSFSLQDDLRNVSRDPVERCSQPIFSSIHIVGAAMAHTADAVFTAAALANPSKDSSILKAEMSIAWLQTMKQSDEFSDLGAKASLSRILNTAISTGMTYLNGGDSTQFCKVVTSKFPALVSRWKSPKTDNEDLAGVVGFCSL